MKEKPFLLTASKGRRRMSIYILAFYKIRYKGTRVLLKFAFHRRVLRGYVTVVYALSIGSNYDSV
jgi:hypothetical protein